MTPRRSLDTQIRTTASLRPHMGLPLASSVPHLPMGHAACPRAFARPPRPMHTHLRCRRAPPPSSPQRARTLRPSCTRFLPPTCLPSPTHMTRPLRPRRCSVVRSSGRLVVRPPMGLVVDLCRIVGWGWWSDGRSVGRSDGRMVGWSDGRTVGQPDSRTDGRLVGQSIKSLVRWGGWSVRWMFTHWQLVRRSDSQTVGWSDGRTVRRSDGLTVGRSDGRTVRRSDGRTVGRSDGRTVRRSDGQTVGRSDGRTVRRSDGLTV
jgi:hypothetical protein